MLRGFRSFKSKPTLEHIADATELSQPLTPSIIGQEQTINVPGSHLVYIDALTITNGVTSGSASMNAYVAFVAAVEPPDSRAVPVISVEESLTLVELIRFTLVPVFNQNGDHTVSDGEPVMILPSNLTLPVEPASTT